MADEYIKQKLLEIWELKNYKSYFNPPLNLIVQTKQNWKLWL